MTAFQREGGTSSGPLPVREAWLARYREAPIEPTVEIVDAHHHLWDRPDWQYGIAEFAADIDGGHRVAGTVFVECRSRYRIDGPDALKPVGETEFAHASASTYDAAHPGGTRYCAAVVAHADLRLGRRVAPVLAAHAAAAHGRLRGIRHSIAWDADPVVCNPELDSSRGMLGNADFRDGVRELAAHGLSYDAWVYHPQLDELFELAVAVPEATIIVNHAGGPLGIGRYAANADATRCDWWGSMDRLADCPNVCVKLGGLGMRISGRDFHHRARPPTSTELAAAWRPYVEPVIERFGADRCLFESNFPVEKASAAYTTLWNAFKRLIAGKSTEDKHALLSGTARRLYRLEL